MTALETRMAAQAEAARRLDTATLLAKRATIAGLRAIPDDTMGAHGSTYGEERDALVRVIDAELAGREATQ